MQVTLLKIRYLFPIPSSLLMELRSDTVAEILFLICVLFQCACASGMPSFQGHSQEIPADIKQMMIGCSWMSECPVSLDDLRYLTVTHWGYDNEIHTGHLIVHAKLADEFLEIFYELFDAHFPIERMELIDFYDADDEASMAANNSSAFCCRAITNMPGTFSLHSYGIAIDINPLVNPYVKGAQVLPEGGRAYLDRTQPYAGIITRSEDNACYRIFVSHGYEWGGDLQGRVDYQHFQKQPSAVR